MIHRSPLPDAEIPDLPLTSYVLAGRQKEPRFDLEQEAGEVPVGYVTLRPDAGSGPDEIRQFVAGHVASYKQLRRLEVIDAIPKSASGKILRRVLRDAATGRSA